MLDVYSFEQIKKKERGLILAKHRKHNTFLGEVIDKEIYKFNSIYENAELNTNIE